MAAYTKPQHKKKEESEQLRGERFGKESETRHRFAALAAS